MYNRCSGKYCDSIGSKHTLYLASENSDEGRNGGLRTRLETIFNTTRRIFCVFEEVVGV